MVLPIFAILEKLDPALLEAAADLGARPLRALLRVTLPLSKPGIIAGAILVFVPCLGAYLTPDLMGGGKTVMIGNLVQNQFSTARDWPFGAAASFILMAITALAITRSSFTKKPS
jgi:spermidine/putrescine transport system permease protein